MTAIIPAMTAIIPAMIVKCYRFATQVNKILTRTRPFGACHHIQTKTDT